MHLVLTSNPRVVPYAAADTWACLRFPNKLTSHLSAIKDDALAP